MEQAVATVLFVFVRLVTVMSSLPLFGSLGMPRQVVLVASICAAIVVTPHLPPVAVPLTVGTLVFAGVLEMVYGLLLTLGIRIVFAAVGLAGEMMGLQMGLALATLFDPLQRESSSALGTLSTWLAGLVFLGTGLHLTILELVAESFRVSPPGGQVVDLSVVPSLIEAMGLHFALGVQLAGPLIALVFVLNVFMALLTRLAPRMNVFFALGLTATSVCGMLLLWASMPWWIRVHLGYLQQAVAGLARALSAGP